MIITKVGCSLQSGAGTKNCFYVSGTDFSPKAKVIVPDMPPGWNVKTIREDAKLLHVEVTWMGEPNAPALFDIGDITITVTDGPDINEWNINSIAK